MEALMLNAAYAVYFGSAVVRGLLPVRITLLTASVLYVLWGAVVGNRSIIAWNVAFGLLSIYQIWRILQQRRPIVLTDHERLVYEAKFGNLTDHDFVFLWEMGEDQNFPRGSTLTEEGGQVEDLFLLLHGSAAVTAGGSQVASLEPLNFIGEMSLLSRRAATAQVTAEADVTVRRWSQDHLRGLSRIRPEIASDLWRILGEDLIHKVHSSPGTRESTSLR